MRNDTPQLELDTLRRRQGRAREEEVFGGLTPEERAAYDLRQDRIHELERTLAQPANRHHCNRDLSPKHG